MCLLLFVTDTIIGHLYLNCGSVFLNHAAYAKNDPDRTILAQQSINYFSYISDKLSVQTLALENMGKAQWLAGEFVDSLSTWEALSASGKLSRVGGFVFGVRYWESNYAEQAIQVWLSSHVPGEAILNLRDEYRSMPDQLSKLADIAISLKVADPDILKKAAYDYEVWGLRSDAASLWTVYTQNHATHTSEYWYAAGQAAYLSNEFDEAVSLFTQGWQQWPNDERFPERLVSVFAQVGQLESAIETAKQWAIRFPNTAVIYQQLGELYFAKKDLDSASEWWAKSLELYSNNAYVLWRLGEVKYAAGSYSEAQHYYEAAINADATRSQAYRGLARVYYAMGNISSAIAKMQEAIEKYEYAGCMASWYEELGDWYEAAGDAKAAHQARSKALACN